MHDNNLIKKSKSHTSFGIPFINHRSPQSIRNQLHAFDLYIDSVKMTHKGYFYIVWKKGNKSTQTLKYNSQSSNITTIKQTLCLNLALQFRSSQALEKNTLLYIVNSEGRTIDQISLSIHHWSQQFSNISIPLENNGVIQAKVRAKMLMQIDSKIALDGDADYQNDWKLQGTIQKVHSVYNTKPEYRYIDSSQDQLSKLRKQLEDALYFNSKLKNDRNVLISKNLSQEGQLTELKRTIKIELERIQKYYESLIQVRENIYEDEINKLIEHSNVNLEANFTILQNLLNQQMGGQRKQHQMKLQNMQYAKDIEQFSTKLSEIQSEKNQMKKIIANMQNSQQKLILDNAQLQRINQQNMKQLDKNAIVKDKLNKQILQLSLQMQTLRGEKEKIIEELKFTNQNVIRLEKQNQRYSDMIGKLNQQSQLNRHQLDFTEQAYKKQKQENQKKEQFYRGHIKKLEQFIQNLSMKAQSEKQTEKQKIQQNNMISKKLEQQMRKNQQLLLEIAIQNAQKDKIIAEKDEKTGQYQKQEKQRKAKIPERDKEQSKTKIRRTISGKQLENMNEGQLVAQVKSLIGQIEKLYDENNLLKRKQQYAEQKIMQCQQLQIKSKQLEDQLNKLQQNKGFQDINEMKQKITHLQEQKAKLQQQKQQLVVKYDYLTVQMAKKYSDAQKQKKLLEKKLKQIKIVEYCESEDQQNQEVAHRILETYQNIMQKEFSDTPDLSEQQEKQKNTNYVSNPKHKSQSKIAIQRTQSQDQKLPKKRRPLKRYNSMNVPQLEQNFLIKQQIIDEESAQSRLVSGDEDLNQDQQKQFQKIKIYREKINLQKLKKKQTIQSNDSKKSEKKFSFKIPDHKQFHDQDKNSQKSQQTPKHPKMNKIQSLKIQKKQSISIKDSKKNNSQNQIKQPKMKSSQISDRGRQPSEKSKSKEISVKSRKSYQSFVSKDTMYMFQKVSHRQKIDKLTKDLQSFKITHIEDQKLKNILDEQLQDKQKQIYQLKYKIKRDEQQMLNLKQNNYELEKSNKIEKINTSAQTQIQKQSKHVQASIPDPQKYSIQQQLINLRRQFSRINEQFSKKSIEAENHIKSLIIKIDEYGIKYEHLLLKYDEQCNEFTKMKKQTDQKQKLAKDSYQQLKLLKTQSDFDLNIYFTENKRLKSRIQELQDKLKKNDVMDLLRQTQFEAENSNKRIIQLNRNIHQNKLEKQTMQDENKILRKKINDFQKKNSQASDQVERLERTLEELRRKQNKLGRQLEDRQDTIQKLKGQIKRLNDEVSNNKSYQTQLQFDKKKLQDQINSLNNILEQKQYELSNLKKQNERFRKMIHEKQEQKLQRKSELRRQIQKLQQALTIKDKEVMELESIVKQLSNRIDYEKTETRKNLDEKAGTFSEKLKSYSIQLHQMKKVHDQNLYQMSLVSEKLRETYDELQSLKSNYYKLQNQNNQSQNQRLQIQGFLEKQRKQNEQYKQSVLLMQGQLDIIRNAVKLIKEDLSREKKQGVLKKQTIAQLSKENQQHLEAINRYKVKLSNFEIDEQITKNYTEKLKDAERQSQHLTKQLREVKSIHEEYRFKYQNTPQQLENAVQKIQNKWKQKYQNSIEKLRLQLQDQVMHQKKKYQTEILDLLNSLSRAKNQSQNKSQIISQLELKLSKLQILPLKIEQLEGLYHKKQKQCEKFRQFSSDNQTLIDKITRVEDSCSRYIKQKDQISATLQQTKIRKKQLQNNIIQLQQLARALESESKMYANKIEQLQNNQKQLKNQIRSALAKIRAQQQENQVWMKAEEERKQEYYRKINSLQNKLQLMNSTIRQHAQQLQIKYQMSLDELTKQIDQLNQEVFGKCKIIGDLENIIDRMHMNNQETKRDGQKSKVKLTENQQFFQIQLNKFKNKFVDHEKMYKANIQDLQSQLQSTNQQLTALKLKNISQKQLKLPHSEQSMNSIHLLTVQKLQDKMKQKQQKIQELQNNIFILEQSILKFKKNNNQSQQLYDRIAKLQKDNLDLINKLKNIRSQQDLTRSKQLNSLNSMRSQISGLKKINQNINLQLEQKYLELESINFELNTIKRLYNDLQGQLDRRKNTFHQRNQQETRVAEIISEKQQKIGELQSLLQDMKERVNQSQSEIDKKNHIINTLQAKFFELEKSENKMKNSLNNKLSQEGNHYKEEIKRLSDDNQNQYKQIRRLKEQMQKLEKDNWQFSTQISMNQSSIDNLSLNLEQMTSRYKELEFQLKKYQKFQQKCFRAFQISLNDAFLHDFLPNRLSEKQYEINSLLQEVDELKFLNERKLMDYNELKKQNYTLQLKADDAQYANEQVQQLRQICDKLQQQKKEAIFSLQFFMMQFETIILSSHGQLRERLEDVVKKGKTTY